MSSEASLRRLAEVETGMISDCMLRLGLHGWMDGVRCVQGPDRRAVGPARTLLFGPKRGEGQWPHSMYRTIGQLQAGDVLVIGAGATDENLMGDNVATHAALHGLTAIVTDSMVRDGAGMRGLDMPIFARGISARLPMTMEPVALDVPLVCAGAQVRPGDLLAADGDGVLVLPAARVDDILLELEDVEPIERSLQQAIAERAPLEVVEGLIKRKKARRT
jgi:4-hydroxy-4-methyl-2-oxoglutarate aldolase